MIYQKVNKEELLQLINQVRTVRSTKTVYLSAKPHISLKDLLKEIFEKEVYKNDFINVTSQLLFEDVNYDTSIQVINEIIELLK